jgi:hypothetical protein
MKCSSRLRTLSGAHTCFQRYSVRYPRGLGGLPAPPSYPRLKGRKVVPPKIGRHADLVAANGEVRQAALSVVVARIPLAIPAGRKRPGPVVDRRIRHGLSLLVCQRVDDGGFKVTLGRIDGHSLSSS